MFATKAGTDRRPPVSSKLHGTRYAFALAILIVLTLSSFLIMRQFVQQERSGDAILSTIEQLRTDLGLQQLAMRDLVGELRSGTPDDTRLRGQRRALIGIATKLRGEFRDLQQAMITADLSASGWRIINEPPYNLRSILSDMDADVRSAVRDSAIATDFASDDEDLLARARDEGFQVIADGHAAAARLATDRLSSTLHHEIDLLQQEIETRHAQLGWCTLLVLIGEALMIFWPLIGNLGREVRRADEATNELARLARHDSLTGLLNRASLITEIERAIAAADPRVDRLAVMLIDLDRFKPVNDMFGHAAGDEVLIEIGRRLQASLRPGDVVARLGGDEFVVLLPRAGTIDEVHDIGRRIDRTLSHEMAIEGHRLRLGASIGCAFWPTDAVDVDGLLSSADLAMYHSKRTDGDGAVFFDEGLRSDVAQMRSEEAELRAAIADEQLTLLYQPIVSLDGLSLHGFEALLRWNHPRRGLLGPDHFLPTAERAGLMSQLTTWVIERACRQNAAWLQLGHAPGLMSINVPEAFLTQPDAVAQILEIADRHGVAVDALALEVSERAMTGDDHAPIARQLDAAHDAGLRIALDEFGLGPASLIHLRKPGIDILKIDRAFVCDLTSAPENVAIVGAMIELARILDKQIVVEGIENAEQAALLAISERAWVQGFLHARPLDATAAARFMGAHRPAGLTAARLRAVG